MPLPNIVLDDRTYVNLKAELRRRIPAYTPEWTDFNESDPGIALIELFAWLAEILIYRINQIPDKAYVKFLQMIGIQLNGPAAAQTYLTFTLTSPDLPFAVAIDGQTQVSLSNSSGGSPVIFETTDNLYAVGASLAAVQYFDAARFTVVNNFNPSDGSSYYAFGQFPQAGGALYLGFDRAYPTDGGFAYPLTILVADTTPTGDVQGGPANLQTFSPPITAALEFWNGTGWQTVTMIADGTANLTKSGVITFNAPQGWVATLYGALKRSSDTPLYWMRYRIDQVLGSGYQSAPQLTNILINTISAVNSVTVPGELIGASNGLPNQTFQISNFPILKNPSATGIVAVDEGDGNGFTLWTEVQDFAASDRNAKVYTLDYSTGVVGFGDGVNGKIPHWLSSDASNLESSDTPNIQVTEYHWGGGVAGNAGPGSITNLEKAIPFVASVTNPVASQLGADEETVSAAEDRAPLALQTLSRAVSINDFIYLAKQTPGARIQRATALPLQRPQSQVVRAADGTVIVPAPAPGVVTVIVVPDGPDPEKPVATQQTLAAVAKYLDGFRLLTCELHVTTPVYRLVEIQANVIVAPNALSGQVQDALENALLIFYNPLTGGQPVNGAPTGPGWDFGGTIFVSDAYGQILNVDGVLRIDGAVKIFVDGVQQPQDQDIALQPFELVYSTHHTLDVSYPQ
jgi:predicted phage baseplate assembly protein